MQYHDARPCRRQMSVFGKSSDGDGDLRLDGSLASYRENSIEVLIQLLYVRVRY